MLKTSLTCLQKSIQLLSRREYSHKELIAKLLTYGYSLDEINLCIDKLQQKNLQNNTRFSEYIARKNINKGSFKLLQELNKHDLSIEDISIAKDIVNQQGNELERATQAWEKKFLAKYIFTQNIEINDKELYIEKQKLQQKYLRFLLLQGFCYEICMKVLKDK